MSIAEALNAATARLAEAGIDSARLDARVLLGAVLGVSAGAVRTLSHELTAEEAAAFEAAIIRRAGREPLAYITGHKEFWSLEFEVGPGALVPRPETETLIEQALKAFPISDAPLRILDLGTGSGCLLVTALTLYPNATGTGIDLSPAALEWTRRNAARHSVAPRTRLIEGSWDAADSGPYDLILSNPPYIGTAEMGGLGPELSHEPASALESGPEGLEAYRALAPVMARVLAPQGLALLELGAGQGEAVSAILSAHHLEITGIIPDLAGIPRALTARHGDRGKNS